MFRSSGTWIRSATAAAITLAGLALALPAGAQETYENRTFDSKGVDVTPVKFSIDIPKGWEVSETIRDKFQLVINVRKPGGPGKIAVWLKKADQAQADKWLNGDVLFSKTLSAKAGSRDGFKTVRKHVADKNSDKSQSVSHGLAKHPWYFVVESDNTPYEPWRATYIGVADHMAGSIKIK